MARINADPQALRDFASRLSEFQQNTHEQIGAIAAQLSNLGWDDAKYQEYSASFEAVQNVLANALLEIETEHVPHLTRLADALEQFEQEHGP